MKKLSVVITFWDGDFDRLPHIFDNVTNHIHIPYEIIIVDNREQNNLPIPENIAANSIHVKSGYNAACIPGRIFGAEKAGGKYLWFIDADDGIADIDDETLLDNESDILSFHYNLIPSDSQSNPLNSEFGHFIYECGVSVWNKWYRRETFLAAKNDVIGTGLHFYGEDFIYNYFVFHQHKDYKKIEQNIYFHYASTGSVNGIYKMSELFNWSKKSGFSSAELEDMHKIYVNFIFQSIYNEMVLPDSRYAYKKINFFKSMLTEARDKGWLSGIISYNRYTEENTKPIVDKIAAL